ncbi:hypothetical protein K8I28_17220 [bacterium]|nr:hypothetical protein [bacterium]
MKRFMLPLLVLGLIFLAIPQFAAAHCGSCGVGGEKAGHDKAAMCKVSEDGKAKGATMGAIYESSELYHCSVHSIVSDNPEAKCPSCDAKLAKMTDKEVAELQKGQAVGCPMCPVVMDADKVAKEDQKCGFCKMQLQEIEHGEGKDHKHHDHHGHEMEMKKKS